MIGLTANGFERKRLIKIKSDLEDNLKSVFGSNIDLTPQSGFGQFIGIIAEALSNQWESQENVYNSQYPATAQYNQLSNVVQYNGITRQEATYTTVNATFFGLENTIIPIGSKCKTNDAGIIFTTIEEIIIPASGSIISNLISENKGYFEAAIGTLTIIETPLYGWLSVNNTNAALPGSNKETDAELRARRTLSTQAAGQNLTDSLIGQLLNLDGVEDAIVISNGTNTTNPEGIPAHQFTVTIIGGTIEDVAQIIWKNTPQGIQSYGSLSHNIIDIQGFIQTIYYNMPNEIDIFFKINISINDDEFPPDGEDNIKDAIVKYGWNNFKIYDNVILSEFYTAINETIGILSIDLRIGLSTNPSGTSNIIINFNEISRYDVSKIEVNIV